MLDRDTAITSESNVALLLKGIYMAPQDLDQYVIRINSAAYATLTNLVGSSLRPASGRFPGVQGNVFSLSDKVNLLALDDSHLLLDTQVICAEVYSLPSAAYMAIVSQSPSFRQYEGLDLLLETLQSPDTQATQLTALLAETIDVGVKLEQPPQLITPNSGFRATWVPAATRFVRTETGLWFCSLAFQLQACLPTAVLMTPRTTFGIDLGSYPMACLVGGDKSVQVFGDDRLRLVNDLRAQTLSTVERRLLRRLTYAARRQDAERCIHHLATRGSTVFAERLTLEGMWNGFVVNGRLQATIDFHFSWLPQALFRAGVPFRRVDPAHTSQRCHVHKRFGKRLGKVFTCPDCAEVQHADINAAHNIHDRGIAVYGVLPWRRVS